MEERESQLVGYLFPMGLGGQGAVENNYGHANIFVSPSHHLEPINRMMDSGAAEREIFDVDWVERV